MSLRPEIKDSKPHFQNYNLKSDQECGFLCLSLQCRAITARNRRDKLRSDENSAFQLQIAWNLWGLLVCASGVPVQDATSSQPPSSLALALAWQHHTLGGSHESMSNYSSRTISCVQNIVLASQYSYTVFGFILSKCIKLGLPRSGRTNVRYDTSGHHGVCMHWGRALRMQSAMDHRLRRCFAWPAHAPRCQIHETALSNT
eukprot:3941965-Rhodomonas_salina.2